MGVRMNEYKYYIFDNKEYYEIWNGENLLKSESGDFCEGLLSLYNDIHYSRQTDLSNIRLYRNLSISFYKNRQNKEQGKYPKFLMYSNVYLFLLNVLEQYANKTADVAPEDNTWFRYDYSDDDNQSIIDTNYLMYNFAEKFLEYCSDGKEEVFDFMQVNVTLNIHFELRNGKIVEVLQPSHTDELLYYMVLKIYQEIDHHRLWVIRCNRCKRLFPNYKYGRKVMYCNYKNEFGESCHDIISYYAEGRNKTELERHLQKVYIRYYDEQRRKRKKKIITKEQVAIWSKNARAMRDLCMKGEITEEDFVEWLDKNKENYTEAN